MDDFISLAKSVIEFWKRNVWGYLARENKKVPQCNDCKKKYLDIILCMTF